MKKLAQVTNVYSDNKVYLFNEDQKEFNAFVNKIDGKLSTKEALEKLESMVFYEVVLPYTSGALVINIETTEIPCFEV